MSSFGDEFGSVVSLDARLQNALGSVMEASSNPLLLTDESGMILAYNENGRTFFQSLVRGEFSELTSRNYVNLLVDETGGISDRVEETLRGVYDGTPDSTRIECTLGLNGNSRRFNLDLNPFPVDGRTLVTVVHKRPWETSNGEGYRRSRRVDLFEELHEKTRTLMKAKTPDEVAETTARIARDFFEPSTLGFRRRVGNKLVLVEVEDTDIRTEGREPPPYEIGEGFVGRAFNQGEPRVIDDLESASRDASFDYSPMKSAMLLPVGRYGMINMATDRPADFDELDLELGKKFAADVEAAFERAAREEELRETTTNKNYIRSVLDALPAGCVVIRPDGFIKTTNRSLNRMLNYGAGELVEESVDILFNDGPESADKLLRTIREMIGPLRKKTEFVTSEGRTVSAYLTGIEFERRDGFDDEIILTCFQSDNI